MSGYNTPIIDEFRSPAWFHNLKASPRARIEVGDGQLDVRAEELTGSERNRWFAEQARRYPGFAGYQTKTTRVIPVVALVPQGQS